MLRDLGHPSAEGERRLRRHLRERPGGRAHVAPVPAGQPPRRAGARHRRPVRAGAGLVHLRRRRPDVALQRQRLGAEDADPASCMRWAIDTDQFGAEATRCCSSIARHRDLARADPAADGDEQAARGLRERVGPYELQDFFLYYILRFGYRPTQGRVPGPPRVGRPRARRPWPDLIPPDRRNAYSLAEIKPLARRVPGPLLPHQPVQALGDARTRRRSARAARCRRAATGARPATASPTAWLEELRGLSSSA